MPPLTKNDEVIFGKNSDRPQNEVQEVIYVKERARSSKLKCTYITIDESYNPINSVILSKPAWMWGAEMGANNKNVVIGNEAVWTNNNEGEGDARQKRLLGMDLVRLGLERGNSADEALDVIIQLLERYGQGGPCSEFDDSHFYHNSFLIADCHIAWALETSGKMWAAQRITNGFKNISNGLTIRSKIDRHSEGLLEKAQAMGLWSGRGQFDFTECFSAGGDERRLKIGERLLRQGSATGAFGVREMFSVLRNKSSGICRGPEDTFPTQGSQVSTLSARALCVHWFTATPDPSVSYFKPFIFTPNAQVSLMTASPNEPGWQHQLYKLHAQHLQSGHKNAVGRILRDLERGCLSEIEEYDGDPTTASDLDCLMVKCTEAEAKLYGHNAPGTVVEEFSF
ncbi:unnamed protein product, partial [Iphiclides podalirius]